MSKSFNLLCTECYGGYVYPERARLLKRQGLRPVCLECGERLAHQESRRKASMVIPINKSTPTYISDIAQLQQLNPKRTV